MPNVVSEQDLRRIGVAHACCGKLIVATGAEQESAPAGIAAGARACSAGELTLLSTDKTWAMEPAQIDPARADRFYSEIRKYWPALADGSLRPAYSEIRKKLSVPGEHNADFVIRDGAVRCVNNLVNLFGIESPALTSCLAFAEHVAQCIAPFEHGLSKMNGCPT